METNHGNQTQNRKYNRNLPVQSQPTGDSEERSGNVQEGVVLDVTEEELASGGQEYQESQHYPLDRRPVKPAGEPEYDPQENYPAENVKRKVDVAGIHGR